MALIKRLSKGSPLTFAEGDANLDYLFSLATNTGSLNVSGSSTVTGSVNVTGSSTVTGSFNVVGSTTTTGSVNITGSVTTTGSFNVTGSINVVGSSTTTGSINVTGSINITGSIGFSNSTGSVLYLPYLSGSFTTSSLNNLTGSGAPFFYVINGVLWFYNGSIFAQIYP